MSAIAAASVSHTADERPDPERPSVWFAVRPNCASEGVGALALAIYKDGLTSRVEATDRPHQYRLYNRHPGNLIEIEAIRVRLSRQPCILRVDAATKYIGLEAVSTTP